ncbi:MAG: sodium-dependent transporter [Rhodothermaceae bacterium]|nr:sodium-dependent transporter [Rhodothermaceae bacterium]
MANTEAHSRGNWNSTLGFVLAAAGSAVGLGNIWGFPSQVADNGGAIFILIYLICCFAIGLPVMIAELTIGRHTKKNPVGAFRMLGKGPLAPLIGVWGLICGVMILAFYLVVSGWTLAYVIEEILYYFGQTDLAAVVGNLEHGTKNAIFSVLFMLATITIITGGISNGIEKATKMLMPVLVGLLLIMIFYVLTLDGAMDGVKVYLMPDFSELNTGVVLSAMGQAFFSLSLGMGALITYGSYISKHQNIVHSATYVTLADIGIAFLAGFLIIPAMYVALGSGINILDDGGNLVAGTQLVFIVLPEMFHNMGSLGLLAGVAFFTLLSLAALTSTISLLEVPVAYAIDEHRITRRKAAWGIGSGIAVLAVIVSYNIQLIDVLVSIFNEIGLPLGGLMICLFLGYFWKTENALLEISKGYENVGESSFGAIWSYFIRYICPLLIGLVFISTIYSMLPWFD